LLADLTAALDSARVPWFLFGAQAAILYGAARLTADVDVTSYVLTTLEELERALGQSDLVPFFQSASDAARRE
jgi:hypothetical protein